MKEPLTFIFTLKDPHSRHWGLLSCTIHLSVRKEKHDTLNWVPPCLSLMAKAYSKYSVPVHSALPVGIYLQTVDCLLYCHSQFSRKSLRATPFSSPLYGSPVLSVQFMACCLIRRSAFVWNERLYGWGDSKHKTVNGGAAQRVYSFL